MTNIQPVLPFRLNDDWNLVTRTILPIVSQPGLTPEQDRKWGTGDTLFTAFFVPAESGDWTWGVGRVVQLRPPVIRGSTKTNGAPVSRLLR